MREKGEKKENMERDSLAFAKDQRIPLYRRRMKYWVEKGFPKFVARSVAREESRKPQNG